MANGIEALAKMQSMQNSSLAKNAGSAGSEQLKETAQEFEAIFVKMMLDSMKKTLNKEDRLFDGGMAEEVFDDMLQTEYSRLMAKSGDFGIAKAIERAYLPTAPRNPYQ